MPFVTPAQLPAREILGGHIRGHYAHLDKMTFGEVGIAAGTDLPMHQHPHEQFTYCLSGTVRFVVGAETVELKPGMLAIIPGGVQHGGKVLTDARLIDIFSPVREDYR